MAEKQPVTSSAGPVRQSRDRRLRSIRQAMEATGATRVDLLAVLMDTEADWAHRVGWGAVAASLAREVRLEGRLRAYADPFHRPVTDRACLHCGEPFPPARVDARYCSPKCRQRAHRARNAS